ncbi:MAG: putative Ig domain-containing protein, partial [Deltaproteobacteria bacterium]
PGSYTLSLVVDPDGSVPDLDRTNNAVAAPSPLAISADGLQILGGSLPPALLAVPYAYQLEAIGTEGATAFGVVAGGLPAGLSLAPSGLLSGTPSALGGSTFVVQATSGQKQQLATFSLTVAQPSGPLQIVVSGPTLPPATVGRSYILQLAAVGGVPPYRWSGSPPGGGDLTLEPSGLLAGTPSTTAGVQSFPVIVTDQAGNEAQANLSLEIVDVGTLAITTTSIGPATVGQSFVGPIEATESDGLSHTYRWTLPVGQSLPPGLSFVSAGSAPTLGQVSGTPGLAGSWPFRVHVTDESGHEATREFVLVVAPAPLAVSPEALPDATVGKPYQATVQVSSSAEVTFSLFSGDLPPGLSLGQDGSISGTVDAKADASTFAFAVLAIGSNGDQALLPLSITVKPSTPGPSGGCGTGGGGLSLLALLAALLLATSRRRAWLAALGCAGLVVVGASSAQAAFGYSVAQGTATFSDITGQAGTVVLSAAQETIANQYTLSLPFKFNYDGTPDSSMTVWSNGAVSFDPNSAAVTSDRCGSFPFSSGCPSISTLLAPWWGDLTVCYQASVAWSVSGQTGSRIVTVQWTNLNPDDSCFGTAQGQSLFTFQLRLHEGSGAIEVLYGPSTQGSAVCNFGSCAFGVGIEDGALGLPGLACNTACGASNFPAAGTDLVFSARPDLQLTQLSAPTSAEQGGPATIQLVVQNEGAVAASGATGALYYSSDGSTYDQTAPLAGLGPFNLAGDSAATLRRTVTLPASAVIGSGYVIATIQDSGDGDPAGKLLASAPFDVFAAAPDLVPTALQIPSSAAPGSTVSFAVGIGNQGSATATNVSYSYYLSTDPTVSLVDLSIGGGTIPSLAPGKTFQSTDQVKLPASLPTGVYTVGVIVDPAGTSPESSRSNETLVASGSLSVGSGTLAVATAQLPGGQLGAPYDALLSATGGDGHYRWSVSQGSLPEGLSLDPALGVIAGTAAASGTSQLTDEVKDGSGHSATMPLSLQIGALALPLAVVTSVLPGGSFGVPYEIQLVATGGAPPYQWSVAAGTGQTPPGVALSADGTLAGSPAADGAFVFQAQVTDASGKQALSAPLDLEVLSPGRVSIAQSELSPATVGKSYEGVLLAVGGTPPYQWQLVSDERLPGGPGDTGQDLAQAMP